MTAAQFEREVMSELEQEMEEDARIEQANDQAEKAAESARAAEEENFLTALEEKYPGLIAGWPERRKP